MPAAILVLNAGSSSLKFSVFGAGAELALRLAGNLEELQGRARFRAQDARGIAVDTHTWEDAQPPGQDGAIAFLLDWLAARLEGDGLWAVGHRVVHGGVHYAAPVRVTPSILSDLERLVPLAPLHQPHNLLPIRTLAARLPQLPQVACFDTGFHRSQPAVAQAFALPSELSAAGVRRYGFHGLSYEYIASVLAQYDVRAASGRTVVLHLGNGASMCALREGKSIATTMGSPRSTACLWVHAAAASTRACCCTCSTSAEWTRGHRGPGLQALGIARRVGHLERHARAAAIGRGIGARGHRAILLSHRARARLAGGSVRWPRCDRVHRRHRRKRRSDPRARVPRCGVAGRAVRPCRQPAPWTAHFHPRIAGCSVGHRDGRRADDRPAYLRHAAGKLTLRLAPRPSNGRVGNRCGRR